MILSELILNLQHLANVHGDKIEVELYANECTFTLDTVKYVKQYDFFYASKNAETVLLEGSE